MAPEMVILPKQPRSVRKGYSNVRGKCNRGIWTAIRAAAFACEIMRKYSKFNDTEDGLGHRDESRVGHSQDMDQD